MTEDKKQNKIEELKEETTIEKKDIAEAEKNIAKEVTKIEEKVEENKITQKEADKEINEEVEDKIEETKEEKKVGKKQETIKSKKNEAIVNGKNLHISTKHSIAICNFIRNKNIDKAILELEEAKKKKIAIPMRGEIPHKKGIMSGRYPINAIKEFIILLKSLKANAFVNELELEKYKIFCKADFASRPYKKFGRQKTKRTHVLIKLIPITKKKSKK